MTDREFVLGSRVLVEFPNDCWEPGTFDGYRVSSDPAEDFLRLNIRLDKPGQYVRGAHPRHVKAAA